MIQEITSATNQRVKDWVKLQTKRGRRKQGKYLLDGWHLVKEAIAAQAPLLEIIFTAESKHHTDLPDDLDVPYFQITDSIAKKLSTTPSPQGIFATVALPEPNAINPNEVQGAWLFLDQVQDPGNIGTLVRTADAAGFAGVVFGNGTADYHQPKVLRAMQGSQFHLQLVDADLTDWITSFRERALPVFGSELNEEAKQYDQVGKYQDFALVMGNEGNGMQADLLALTSDNLYIPIKGYAESLNVAIAAGILMFQLRA